jgi:hypothetical protein
MYDYRDGWYCLLIAILQDCTVEKAIALYENRSAWITPDLIEEMKRVREYTSLSEMEEMYGMSKSQLLQYLKGAHRDRKKTMVYDDVFSQEESERKKNIID